ncbi:MAG: DUF423 domain-containing protein [Bacteroidetes bacterium]|nr:DUF423 domain-containing protein [Bacteroidota bacterium]
MNKKQLALACLLMALAVGTGAFGAHFLRETLKLEARGLEVWDIAVRYLFWNALGLGLLALLPDMKIPSRLILSGVLVFSLTLFPVALNGHLPFRSNWLGAVTPVGGVLMIAGWIWAARRLWKQSQA